MVLESSKTAPKPWRYEGRELRNNVEGGRVAGRYDCATPGDPIVPILGASESHGKGEPNAGSRVEIGWGSVEQRMDSCQRVMWQKMG